MYREAMPVQGQPDPIQGALEAIKQKRNLGMTNPATTSQSGTEFMVDKGMAPAGLKQGDEVYVKGTVTKTGSQISVSPSGMELCSTKDGGMKPEVVEAAEEE